ncbi:Protein FAM124B [Merluccius polli]|uniref:Protein FAM124B n=1 Tax=Merluccius polli TaxID=89951 RepID=A0AA47NTY0_MERPO|nr:Protein FAM124B [Merluccius polli]
MLSSTPPEPGLCLQLAVKQLSPGVRVEPCSSAVLQFSVEEIGQLVPLLPNPCTPISASRWQTEDLDGNKILFQVKTSAQPQRPLTSAFALSSSNSSLLGPQQRGSGHASTTSLNLSPTARPGLRPGTGTREGHRLSAELSVEKPYGRGTAGESQLPDSCCSTPPGSSCYSSQRSSPALPSSSSTSYPHDSPLRPSISRSLSHLLLEEEQAEEPETNVDTGAAISLLHRRSSDAGGGPMTRSSSSSSCSCSCSAELQQERRPASGLETLARELSECLPKTRATPSPGGASWTWGPAGSPGGGAPPAREGLGSRTLGETGRTTAELNHRKPPAAVRSHEPTDEFFI